MRIHRHKQADTINTLTEADKFVSAVNSVALMTEIGKIYELTADEGANSQYDTFKVSADGSLVKLTLDQAQDAANEWVPLNDYSTGNQVFSFVPTQTTARDFQGNLLVQGQRYFGEYDTPQAAGATLTIAEIAKIKTVADPSLPVSSEAIVNKVAAIRDAATSTNTEYPTEKAVRTELDLKHSIADIVTVIRDAANSEDTKTVSEKAIRTALDSLPTNFLANTDTFNSFAGLTLQVLRVNAAEDAVEAIALAANLVAYDNTTATITGNPATTQAAIDALKALIDAQPLQTSVATFGDLPDPTTVSDGAIVHVIDASGDATITAGWAKYQEIGDAWFKYLSLEDLQSIATITDAQIQDITDTTVGAINGGKQLFDREQALKGVAANFDDADADYEVAKAWDGKTISDQIKMISHTPLPAADATLELGYSYYGRVGNTYTIPDPGPNDPIYFEIFNTSPAKGGTTIPYNTTSPMRLVSDDAERTSLRVSPGFYHRGLWDAAAGKWDLETNRGAFINYANADNGSALVRNSSHAIYNGDSNTSLTFKAPRTPAGIVEFYYDDLSVGPLRIEQDDILQTGEISFNGTVDRFVDIPVEWKGSWVRLLGNTTVGYWKVQVVRPFSPEDLTRIFDRFILNGTWSSGTDASASMSIAILDEDGNAYPSDAFLVNATLTQTSGLPDGGNIPANSHLASWAVGRNKAGPINITWNPDTSAIPNGVSAINVGRSHPSGVISGSLEFAGTNANEVYTDVSNIPSSPWTVLSASTTDQAAKWVPNQEYPVGSVFSWPEQDPADENVNNWFNWTVTTAIAANEFAVFNATNFATVKAKLDRFGVNQISSSATEVAPTMMVGNRWIWNRSDAIPNHLLPLNGQVVANVDVDYPDLWSVRAQTTLIDSFDDTAKTITLKDYNNQGRFARAGATAGTEQDDQVGSHSHSYTDVGSYQVGLTGGPTPFANSTSQNRTTNTNVTDASGETRPINFSEIFCIIAKPWVVTGNVTVNQNNIAGDHTTRTAGDGSAGTVDTYTIWGDAGETISLGTFTVQNGPTGAVGAAGPQGDAGRGIVTVHRSDGATAIGGTVYTLDHAIYEYTDGVFEDKGLIAAPSNVPVFDWIALNNNEEHVFADLPEIRFKFSSTHRQLTAQATGADVTLSDVRSRWEQTGEGFAGPANIVLTDGTDRNVAASNINFGQAGAKEESFFTFNSQKWKVVCVIGTSFSNNIVEIHRVSNP